MATDCSDQHSTTMTHKHQSKHWVMQCLIAALLVINLMIVLSGDRSEMASRNNLTVVVQGGSSGSGDGDEEYRGLQEKTAREHRVERLNNLNCLPRDTYVHKDYTLPIYELDALAQRDCPLERIPAPTTHLDYTYSRFSDHYPLSSDNSSHFVVLCDRPNSTEPFKAFVNSLLIHSSKPISLHVVKTRYEIPWLDELDSPYFQVNFYHNERLGYLGNAIRLMKKYNFQSRHRSSPFPLTKSFYSTLPYPHLELVKRVIIIDDDILFWEDPSKLFDILEPDKLALSCPEDDFRVNKYYRKTKQQSNGHPTKYCNAGMVHMPILPRRAHPDWGLTNDILDLYVDAVKNMTAEYPGEKYPCSDQQIYNRLFAYNEHKMGNIPCSWHCNYHSCNRGKFAKTGVCTSCPELLEPNVKCKAYHFVAKAFELNPAMDVKTHEYEYFIRPNSLELLYDQFLPRIMKGIWKKGKKKGIVPSCAGSTQKN